MKKNVLVFILFTFGYMTYSQVVVKPKQKNPVMMDQKNVKPKQTEIKTTELLQNIKYNISGTYPAAKIDKAWKIVSGDVVTYKVLIMNNDDEWYLVYDKDGKFISKTSLKEKAEIPPKTY